MTDKALRAIAKTNSAITTAKSFETLNPVWTRYEKYGEEVLSVIKEARDSVYEKHNEAQIRSDQIRQEKEESERATKRMKVTEKRTVEKVNMRKHKDSKEEEIRKKYDAYMALKREGKHPRGRPPRKPHQDELVSEGTVTLASGSGSSCNVDKE